MTSNERVGVMKVQRAVEENRFCFCSKKMIPCISHTKYEALVHHTIYDKVRCYPKQGFLILCLQNPLQTNEWMLG